jgi:hypothetical protein
VGSSVPSPGPTSLGKPWSSSLIFASMPPNAPAFRVAKGPEVHVSANWRQLQLTSASMLPEHPGPQPVLMNRLLLMVDRTGPMPTSAGPKMFEHQPTTPDVDGPPEAR